MPLISGDTPASGWPTGPACISGDRRLLMLTLVFGVLYALCNDLGSAPFFAGKPEDSVVPGDFVYFAVTTQTTVGFGDFVPGTNVGRAFASAQAVIGQNSRPRPP